MNANNHSYFTRTSAVQAPDTASYFGGDDKGYTDYPAL